MDSNNKIDNRIFNGVFASILLLVITIFSVAVVQSHGPHAKYGFLFIPLLSVITSAVLLTRAIKRDKRRWLRN